MTLRNIKIRGSVKTFIDITLRRVMAIIMIAISSFMIYNGIIVDRFSQGCLVKSDITEDWGYWLALSLFINCIAGITNPDRIKNLGWVYIIAYSILIIIGYNTLI